MDCPLKPQLSGNKQVSQPNPSLNITKFYILDITYNVITRAQAQARAEASETLKPSTAKDATTSTKESSLGANGEYPTPEHEQARHKVFKKLIPQE